MKHQLHWQASKTQNLYPPHPQMANELQARLSSAHIDSRDSGNKFRTPPTKRCHTPLDFPTVKLLDYEVKWDALEANVNPFAVVTMAHLQTQATRQNPSARYAAKLQLAKMLYRKGYGRQDILELFRFIDWILTLPPKLEEQFMTDVVTHETQQNKPYITSIERIATRRGMQQGMQQAMYELLLTTLQTRFGTAPQTLQTRLEAVTDTDILKTMHKKALLAKSLDEFVEQLSE